MNILIVEDDAALRDTMKILLDYIGYQVQTADGYGDAVELLCHQPFDVVLIDVYLGSMSGIDLKTYIQDRYKLTKVFLMSGSKGYDLYKPFDIEDLEKLLIS